METPPFKRCPARPEGEKNPVWLSSEKEQPLRASEGGRQSSSSFRQEPRGVFGYGEGAADTVLTGAEEGAEKA